MARKAKKEIVAGAIEVASEVGEDIDMAVKSAIKCFSVFEI